MREYIGPKKKIQKLQSKELNQETTKTIPELRLSGIWLQSNGFYEGQKVEITFGYEYIVIYPYKNEIL